MWAILPGCKVLRGHAPNPRMSVSAAALRPAVRITVTCVLFTLIESELSTIGVNYFCH